jgi:hypothetical protein
LLGNVKVHWNLPRTAATWKPIYIYDIIIEFFWEWEIFLTKVGEKIITPILYSVTFSENRTVYEIMLKDRRQYNTAPALCMLDNYGYKHTLRICNTRCFSTTTMVAWTRLNITFIRTLPVSFHPLFLFFVSKCSVVSRNLERYKTGTLRDVLCGFLD